MNRRRFVLGVAALTLGPAMAAAQISQDAIVKELRRLGYSEIRISRTWLGRIRIDARGAPGRREIVLNPSTGAVLRDYSRQEDDDDRRDGADDAGGQNRNSGDDDDRDDDRGDDSDDDHNDDSDDDRGDDGGGKDDDD